jgi:hypothetical protein
MILADSILQTASMVLCMSVAVTATNHTIFNAVVQARDAATPRCGIRRGISPLHSSLQSSTSQRFYDLA